MMEVLENCALGLINVGNIEYTVFLEKEEFRKSTQFAAYKVAVRIHESFKKFVTGEMVDTRVNYG